MTLTLLPTQPIFPHPPQVDDETNATAICRACGYKRDRAIHYSSLEYKKLWHDWYWWPR